jgi:hypothetical protein
VTNPLTAADRRFKSYLDVHGCVGERDVDWQERFGVEPSTDPDWLVSHAGQQLAICEVKQWQSHPINRRLAKQRFGSFSNKQMYQTAADAIQDLRTSSSLSPALDSLW